MEKTWRDAPLTDTSSASVAIVQTLARPALGVEYSWAIQGYLDKQDVDDYSAPWADDVESDFKYKHWYKVGWDYTGAEGIALGDWLDQVSDLVGEAEEEESLAEADAYQGMDDYEAL